MKRIAFISMLLIQQVLFAQKESNIWYFGYYAGIDFNSGAPVALTNSALYTSEGCASICDANGVLLFYTDGVYVWNRNHQVMSNGSGLYGNESSTQSATIVKKPGANAIYFIFTTDAIESFQYGFRYSEVDMSLQGGLGAVNSNKNILVMTPSCEKVTVIRHRNNVDFWIITHLFNSNAFHSYLLTSAGLNTIPIISNIGSSISGDSLHAIGCLKASLDGSRIASANTFMDNVELFDFDNTTGLLSNTIKFSGFSSAGPYGIEFSPNNNLLYASGGTQDSSYVYQYNLLAGSPSAIINSRITIGSYFSGASGALQLGPDNKIYQTHFVKDSLGVINNPNLPGVLCNYVANGFFLSAGRDGYLGLPALHKYLLYNKTTFKATNLCFGESTLFTFSSYNPIDSVLWNFNDPLSGNNNISKDSTPIHIFKNTGTYNVKLITYFGNSSDTTISSITINSIPLVNLGNDTTLCEGEKLTLNAATLNATYKWQDGSSNSTISITKQGTYWVTVKVNDCAKTDTIKVNFTPIPIVNLGNDTTLCKSEILTLNATNKNAAYIWQDNSMNSTFMVTQQGTYWVTVKVNDCAKTDTINVNFNPTPTINIGNDTTLCQGESLILNASTSNATYLWNDNSTNAELNVTQKGTYWVTVKVNKCATTDAISVNFNPTPTINLGNDTTLCQGKTLILDASTPNATYIWQDNSATPTFYVTQQGTYTVKVTVNNCSTNDVILIHEAECEAILEIPNVFTPNNDGSNDLFIPIISRGIVSMNTNIYNRWGKLIFESDKLSIDWNGQDVSAGTYYWLINYTDIRGIKNNLKGYVIILK